MQERGREPPRVARVLRAGQRAGADHRRAIERQRALAGLGVAPVEHLRRDQLQHGVAEELQPLVVGSALVSVLVRV